MYKEAIDILMDADVDFKAIAIQVAKSNPSVLIKAYKNVTDPRLQKFYPATCSTEPEVSEFQFRLNEFQNNSIEGFEGRLRISHELYKAIIGEYGHKIWLSEFFELMFGRAYERPQTIKAIKLIRTHEGIGLKEAKWLVEDIVEGKFDRRII